MYFIFINNYFAAINLKKQFLLYLIILVSALGLAQDPYCINLNTLKNLPSNQVFDVYQDAEGFIWLATDKGICRYDGVKYLSYKSDKQSSVAGSNIKSDVYGRIWYQNFDGFLYFIENNRLNTINQNIPVGFIPYGLTKDKLFVIQKKGIDVFDLKTLKLITTIPSNVNIPEHATTLNNCFYFIADDVIYKIDQHFNIIKTNYFKHLNLHVKYIYPFKNNLYVISKLNEKQTIYFFDENLNNIKNCNLKSLTYIQGSDVVNDTIWLHTTKGSFAYNQSSNSLNETPFYKDSSISKVLKDCYGNYWFGSTNNGIYIVPSLNDKHYEIKPYEFQVIIKKQSKFLLGTKTGEILETNDAFEDKKLLFEIDENLATYYIYNDTISNHTFLSNKGFFFVNSNNFKNSKNYEIAVKEIVRLDDKYYAFASSNFCGLFKNPNVSNRYASIWDDVFEANKKTSYADISILIARTRAKSVCFDSSKSEIYFSTNTGTFLYNKKGLIEIKKDNKPFYTSKLIYLENKVYALSTQGNLYVIKPNKTLEEQNNKFKITKDGIQIIKQINAKLYLQTATAIYCVSNEQIVKLNHAVNSYKINDFYIDENKLIILTNQGIVSLSLSKQKSAKYLFKINNVLVNNNVVTNTRSKNAQFKGNNIRINFSVLEFTGKDLQIHYRINKGRWNDLESNVRHVEFPSLAPGKYNIEFKTLGVLHKQKVEFEILLPFWKTWWFYLLVFLISATIIYFYFKWQAKLMINQMKLLNEKMLLEKNLSNSVLSAIKSQMNPHFFYNALNTIQAYIFKNDKDKASNYLAKFSKLTRVILEMSEKEIVSLKEEIQSIQLYLELEKMRFGPDFSYDIKTAENIDLDQIDFPPMLLQPYVENAIKHGLLHSKQAKILTIDIKKQAQYLVISIDDNGIGRKRANEINSTKHHTHKSFATKANQLRLDMLNKNATNKITVSYIDKIENNTPKGTTVILKIPLT